MKLRKNFKINESKKRNRSTPNSRLCPAADELLVSHTCCQERNVAEETVEMSGIDISTRYTVLEPNQKCRLRSHLKNNFMQLLHNVTMVTARVSHMHVTPSFNTNQKDNQFCATLPLVTVSLLSFRRNLLTHNSFRNVI